MTMFEFLRQLAEPCPRWLANFTPDTPFDRKLFFSSRIVFYPGHGHDGHPVKAFGSAHAAHCFVYADYDQTQASIEELLDHPFRRFRGYRTLVRRSMSPYDITPSGWQPHANPMNSTAMPGRIQPFAFLEVLEREVGLGPEHGADRLAILFLGADGHATYDALFCQKGQTPPFAILLQDHGFGGNYSPFGQGGLMEGVANITDRKPAYLLAADSTKAWDGYECIPNVDGEVGGMHQHMRHLLAKSAYPVPRRRGR